MSVFTISEKEIPNVVCREVNRTPKTRSDMVFTSDHNVEIKIKGFDDYDFRFYFYTDSSQRLFPFLEVSKENPVYELKVKMGLAKSPDSMLRSFRGVNLMADTKVTLNLLKGLYTATDKISKSKLFEFCMESMFSAGLFSKKVSSYPNVALFYPGLIDKIIQYTSSVNCGYEMEKHKFIDLPYKDVTFYYVDMGFNYDLFYLNKYVNMSFMVSNAFGKFWMDLFSEY